METRKGSGKVHLGLISTEARGKKQGMTKGLRTGELLARIIVLFVGTYNGGLPHGCIEREGQGGSVR